MVRVSRDAKSHRHPYPHGAYDDRVLPLPKDSRTTLGGHKNPSRVQPALLPRMIEGGLAARFAARPKEGGWAINQSTVGRGRLYASFGGSARKKQRARSHTPLPCGRCHRCRHAPPKRTWYDSRGGESQIIKTNTTVPRALLARGTVLPATTSN